MYIILVLSFTQLPPLAITFNFRTHYVRTFALDRCSLSAIPFTKCTSCSTAAKRLKKRLNQPERRSIPNDYLQHLSYSLFCLNRQRHINIFVFMHRLLHALSLRYFQGRTDDVNLSAIKGICCSAAFSCVKSAVLGKWLWRSWQSGHLQSQRTRVRIQSSATFIEHLFTVSCLQKRRK